MEATTLIVGNTFPVKDEIKGLGGRWDNDAKGWRVPADKAAEALAIVEKGSSTGQTAKKKAPSRCFVCGVVPTINSRGYPSVAIYRSGECKDCYEERKMGY